MEKLNIAKLLKDCPKGMELDCTMWENVMFDHIDMTSDYPIFITKMNGEKEYLTEEGCFNFDLGAKCVIFPKGKTTWEGFQRPFKDGDVVVYDNPHREHLQIFIFKDKKRNDTLSTCYLMLDSDELDLEEGAYYVTRFATEEEKQKLFDAIKANGYKWNAEKKELEKLIEPKFKVGDRVHNKNYKDYIYDILYITDKGYRAKEINADSPIIILFGSQEDNYELDPNKFDINTLKPFDKVLVRCNSLEKWHIQFFESYNTESSEKYPFICLCNSKYCQCIPYEGNEYLLRTTDDCDKYYKTWK